MKKIIVMFCLCTALNSVHAQVTKVTKPASLSFHAFYNDFKTAQQIKASSFGDVLKNGSWSNFSDMQMGFGVTFFRGLNPLIDFVSTLDASSIDYAFKDGTTQGSSKFLLDANAGFNLKLSDDSKSFVPYLFGGAGFSYYNKFGVYAPVGLGLQVNVFNEAFIAANIQYKIAASSAVNQHFYYNVGIGLPIGKPKTGKTKEKEVIPVVEPIMAKAIAVSQIRDVQVKVVDEQTGLPLSNVMISLTSDSGLVTLLSNLDGEVVFKDKVAGSYTIIGKLNGIGTTVINLQQDNFETATGRIISVQLSHNDPRFTLAGIVEEKNTHLPVGGVTVSIRENALEKTTTVDPNATDGRFTLQLGANSDFSLAAKKANYISNIEQVSTKGLNRSTTLYVKLVLAIEEAKVNASINLKNIYYATGSSQIKEVASPDLDRLVLFLTDNPTLMIEIASHSDSRGSAASNLLLSRRRAQKVVDYLKGKGIANGRMRAIGYGETRLLNGCKDGVKCTEELHEQNRRTEFKVIVN